MMDHSKKEESRKIEENLLEEKFEKNNKDFKHPGTGGESQKIKLPCLTPVKKSPVKRKSDVIVEEEIKRIRSTDSVQKEFDDKNSAHMPNERDTVTKTEHFVKHEHLVSVTIFPIKSKEEASKKQELTKNKGDKPTSKEEAIGATDESATHTIQTSSNEAFSGTADQSISHLSKNTNKKLSENTINSVTDHANILDNIKQDDTNKEKAISDESTSENRILNSESGDKSTGNSGIFEFSQIREIDNPERGEGKSGTSPKKITSRNPELSSDITLQKNQDSLNKSNTGNSSNSKNCSQQAQSQPKDNTPPPVVERIGRRNCNRRASRDYRLIALEYKSHSIYDIPEPKYVPLDKWQKNAQFIEAQKQLLESFSKKRHPIPKVTSTADIKDEKQFIARRDITEHLKAEIVMLNYLLDFLQFHSRNIRNQIKEMCEIDDNVENADLLPPAENPRFEPSSSPTKTKTNKITQGDNSTLREYPGLAKQPAKVKKDARYQKKFYKTKPVKLPINWKAERNSSPEIEINSDEDRKIIENELEVIPKDYKDCKHKERESPGDNPPIPPKYDDNSSSKEKKPREKNSPGTFADDYQVSSFMEESPTSPSKSISSDKSNSPKCNDEIKSPSTSIKLAVLEGLAARFMPSAGQFSRSHTSSSLKPSWQAQSPLKLGSIGSVPLRSSSLVTSSSLGASPLRPGSQGSSPLKPGSLGASPLKPGSLGASPLKPGSLGASPVKSGSLGASPLKPRSLSVSPLKPRSLGASPLKPSSLDTTPLKLSSLGASPIKPGSLGTSPAKPSSLGASPLKPGSLDAYPLKSSSLGSSPLKPSSLGSSPLKTGLLSSSLLKHASLDTSVETIKAIAAKYNPNFIIDSRTIFMRDLSNIFSADNSLRRLVRLRPYLRIVSYLDGGFGECCVEEFLGMLLRFQNEFLSQDPELSKLTFKLPLFEIPIKTNITPDNEDDDDGKDNYNDNANDGDEVNVDEDEYEYELVGDNLMKPKKNKYEKN